MQYDPQNRASSAMLDGRHAMIGVSQPMLDVYHQVDRVAPSEASIVIQGESGTGKELVARAIHGNSSHRARPFVPINCAALTETLLESEMFGHERGQRPCIKAALRGPMVEPYSWTRSAKPHLLYKASCCAFCRSASSSGWAVAKRCVWMSV
jgi:transcriptional regulator of acetoin/glycerol metabolism